ncbi:23S rRNA (uracil(1939)-C(5))-methyltransferase RlmD [Halalkalibaculum sp. DA3122]|uniref:23S rRNA (uracil(1939)-C(5))-methyltransferase RlmD n=1 Tax=Halalkalibaculum sp. DA3122 TaxID=3373607 RepID=UPI0037543604
MKLKKGADVELDIESTAFKGKGIAKVDGLAVFVPNTTPGDRVRARIIKRKKNYCEAKLLEVIEEGPRRIEPRCRHARMCGGCSWQHVDYASQLEFKQGQVQDHMERIGGLKELEVNPVIACDKTFYYRNKMEYSIGHKRWLSREEIERDEYVSDRCFAAGLHAPGRYDKILNLQECHLQEPISYEILDFVRSYCTEHDIAPFNTIDNKGFMRNVVIRNAAHTDDLMVNLVTFRDDEEIMQAMADALLEQFPRITTIINNINDTKSPTAVGRYEKVLHGPGHIVDSIGGYRFSIDANAFFQTNTEQAERLYETARSFADLKSGDLLFDLYCGVGTLSLFMSEMAGHVVGIENVEVAIENARTNAKNNGVENVEFVKGDMRDVFNQSIVAEFGSPDCIVTDPPRSGMHPDVVAYLNKLKVPRLVYVSCNSSTMARDLKELNEVYDILEVQPVDMFPQTYHIETVANLRLRE